MKTSLAHLPDNKQAELKVIVNVTTQRFSDVEMIILLGYDDWMDSHDDYYILVILTHEAKAQNASYTHAISSTILNKKLPTNVIAIYYGIDRVNKQLQNGNPFFKQIIWNGTLLYSSNRFRLDSTI